MLENIAGALDQTSREMVKHSDKQGQSQQLGTSKYKAIKCNLAFKGNKYLHSYRYPAFMHLQFYMEKRGSKRHQNYMSGFSKNTFL